MSIWNRKRFSVFTSDEKDALGLIEELGKQTNYNTDMLDTKTDITGDHKGSWQGLSKPTLSEEGMRATVEKHDTDITDLQKDVADITGSYADGNVIRVAKNGTIKTISEAIQKAKLNNVNKNKRIIIKVSEGTYNEQIELVNGIDIIGEYVDSCIITFSGTGFRTGDTVKCACDSLLKNLTIINTNDSTSDNQNYPIHIDGGVGDYTCKLENVKAFARGQNAHHAVGIGLGGNQVLYVKDCEFQSDSKSAFYLHNQNSQPNPMYCEIRNTKIYGCMKRNISSAPKCAMLFEDVASSKIDEVKIFDSEIYGYGGIDVVLQPHASYTGNRNTLFVSMKNCKYDSYNYSDDSGTIIDLDNSYLVKNMTGNTKGNPLVLKVSDLNMGVQTSAEVCNTDNNPYVLGVAVNYCGAIFCVTRGVTKVIASSVNQGDFLITKADGGAGRGNATDNIFGYALESATSTHKFIKCLLK